MCATVIYHLNRGTSTNPSQNKDLTADLPQDSPEVDMSIDR